MHHLVWARGDHGHALRTVRTHARPQDLCPPALSTSPPLQRTRVRVCLAVGSVSLVISSPLAHSTVSTQRRWPAGDPTLHPTPPIRWQRPRQPPGAMSRTHRASHARPGAAPMVPGLSGELVLPGWLRAAPGPPPDRTLPPPLTVHLPAVQPQGPSAAPSVGEATLQGGLLVGSDRRGGTPEGRPVPVL